MAVAVKMRDKRGRLLCRYCYYASPKGDVWICRAGDNPGLVDPDIAECQYGEPVGRDEEDERKRS